MRGVLLTILFYLVLLNSVKSLAGTMGSMALSKYAKIVDLTLLIESFMHKLEYSSSELDVAEEFIKGYIYDYCKCVDHQEAGG